MSGGRMPTAEKAMGVVAAVGIVVCCLVLAGIHVLVVPALILGAVAAFLGGYNLVRPPR